jgi:hypothetical protein
MCVRRTLICHALAVPSLDVQPAAAQIWRHGAAMTHDLGHHISPAQTRFAQDSTHQSSADRDRV